MSELKMANIKINDKEYNLDEATDAAKAQLFHLQAIEVEITRMNTLIAVMQTARVSYVNALQQELERTGTDAPINAGSKTTQ